MDAKLQRRIQRDGWDKAAASYESSWERQLAPAHRALLDEADLRPGERVVDIACGTGLVTFAAADAVARWGMVFGTDLSDQMVDQGRAGPRSRCGWAEIFPIVDVRVTSEVCPLFFSLGTDDRVASVFRRAGLASVTIERVETRLEWASADDACGTAFVGGPVALAHSRFDEATRVAAYGEYLSSIERWRHGERYLVPGEFVIVSGRKVE